MVPVAARRRVRDALRKPIPWVVLGIVIVIVAVAWWVLRSGSSSEHNQAVQAERLLRNLPVPVGYHAVGPGKSAGTARSTRRAWLREQCSRLSETRSRHPSLVKLHATWLGDGERRASWLTIRNHRRRTRLHVLSMAASRACQWASKPIPTSARSGSCG